MSNARSQLRLPRNIETNPDRSYWACSRLMATVRLKPTGPSKRPKCTVAMPPDAIAS
jgi:hypothetical protein